MVATTDYPSADDVRTLADRWWALAVRGVLAVAFGIVSFMLPADSLLALVVLFGAYALVAGVLDIVGGIRSARRDRGHWGWHIVQGLFGIAAGIVTLAWPGITALALLYVIAAWAMLLGIAEISAAIRLRKEIEGEWLLGLSGVLSLALGVLMVVFPGAGALALIFWIAAYAVVFGLLTFALALRLRRWNRAEHPHTPPHGGFAPA